MTENIMPAESAGGAEACMGKTEHIKHSGEAGIEIMDAEERMQDGSQEQPSCSCGHYKIVPRDAAGQKRLQNRINRIIGQLNGIGNMIGENRYCGDILIQIGAVESALQSLGYIVLQEHMQTCVVEEVKSGNEAIMEEAIELIKKLK